MEPSSQPAPDDYVWEVPGKPVSVHIDLDVVDRIAAEVMRGFGAVPKRGAEVGGVLIGTIQPGDPAIVRVEDYEAVRCGYKRGPSYLFTAEDRAEFEDACERWMPDATRPAYAVGYFRSQTRGNPTGGNPSNQALPLAPEDVELMERHFPAPEHVALLVKPYGTKVSMGGFFVREDGVFPEATPLEFPFRRRELAGEEAPPRRPLMDRVPRRRDPAPREQPAPSIYDRTPDPEPAYAVTLLSTSRIRSMWIPLSFVFLILGLALGFLVGLSRGTPGAATFSLGLTVAKNGTNLIVKWNPQAGAMRRAPRGVMEIEDGRLKPIEQRLDMAALQGGSLIYGFSTDAVKFRLTVYPDTGVSLTETVDWKQ
jgi:hypothetical protein